MAKIIAQASTRDVTGTPLDFNVVEVAEEVVMFGVPIMNQHHYWVPTTVDIDDEEEYLEPIDDSDYNFRLDFAVYRQKYNLLRPTEIREARRQLHLSIAEVAAILDIDAQTLTEIEDDLALQSFDQEIKLRWLMERTWFSQMVQVYRDLISERCHQAGIDAEKLLRALPLQD